MKRNRFKSIISLALVIFILLPNLLVSATEINESLQKNTLDNTQKYDESNENIDEKDHVELEGSNINLTDDIIQGEKSKEIIEEKENIQVEETIEINSKDNFLEKIVQDSEINKTKDIEVEIGETYEVIEKPQMYSLTFDGLSEEELEREEIKGKLQAISEAKYLMPKTASNYEIAIADSDGTYIYIDSADTIEEAKSKIENMPTTYASEESLPSIINNYGQVVYSTNAMYKMPVSGGNINLYTDPQLSNAFTYVNPGYVEDAPIIEENAIGYKIEIGGFTGWISKVDGYEVVPMNQVNNPSYYMVENGVLKHFISYDLKASINNGHTLTLGSAPSYLQNGVRYFSYDGNYFYDGSNIETGLNNLTSDLKSGHHNNSVNSTNPHYLYFNYLPFRSATNYSADELNNFIDNNVEPSSKLRGIGKDLINAQNTYGVNALLTLSVAINESGWGMSTISQSKNNLFGIKAFDSNPGQSADTFNTPGESVIEFAKNYISRGYSDPADWRYRGGFLGNKNRGANVKYASDPFWGEKAAQYAYRIDTFLSSADQNDYQLAMYKADNQVKDSNGNLLYNIANDLNQYAGYYDTPTIIKNDDIVLKNGVYCYEIYPERHTPINGGGSANKFSGDYRWDISGYVSTNGVKFLNKKNSTENKGVQYQTHIQYDGWQNWKYNGEMSGTSGESKRLEGIRIKVDNLIAGATIKYRTHVQYDGWQDWRSNGEFSGTSGQSKRLEGIEITLENAPGYSIQYRVHVQDFGWQEWKSNGETAGTVGQAKRLEGIEIKIVKDGDYQLNYTTQVQDIGWQDWKISGETSGTVGSSKRLEGIKIDLEGAVPGAKISYQVHVQYDGWQEWKSNGQLAGTVGESKRLEGIKIVLENAPGYKIEYRTHVQYDGWQEWKSQGQMAGTEGQSKRLEAIEIRLVKE